MGFIRSINTNYLYFPNGISFGKNLKMITLTKCQEHEFKYNQKAFSLDLAFAASPVAFQRVLRSNPN